MLHSTKAYSVIDLTAMRETQSALLHMLGKKLNAVIFIITSSNLAFPSTPSPSGELNVYGREVHQIHETQLFELQVYLP
jgi:hypothetical protein